MLYKAKAPGSLMLLGEYAVLQGKTAIVAAIDKFISVSITPRHDDTIHIHSSLGALVIDRHDLNPQAPFEFILMALASKNLPSGCEIVIESELPTAIGLGSSAAVTVALLAALNAWLQIPTTKMDLWQEAMSVIRAVQGQGSGADCAASIYGGVTAFRCQPFSVTPLKQIPPIVAVYSGKKLTTARAINIVNKRRKQQPDFYQNVDYRMDELATKAIEIINEKNWHELGTLFNLGQELMVTLGVSNEVLDSLVKELREQPTLLGAKISGAGLGDCVIAVGTLSSNVFPRNDNEKNLGVKQIASLVTTEGVSTRDA